MNQTEIEVPNKILAKYATHLIERKSYNDGLGVQ